MPSEFIGALLWVPLAALAAGQITETVRHGSIFEHFRAWLEASRYHWLRDLFGCGFCLTHWTALAATLPYALWATGWKAWALVPVVWLATVRLAGLIYDWSAEKMLT